MASRSSEIRRSNPLPTEALLTMTKMSQIVILNKKSIFPINYAKMNIFFLIKQLLFFLYSDSVNVSLTGP